MKEIPVTFSPYIGKRYRSSTNRLMVLGESHYPNNDKSLEQLRILTLTVLQAYLDYKNKEKKHERWMNTFTKFSNVLNGHRLTGERAVNFWEEVAFYNYVQVPTSGTRKSPCKSDFQNSYAAFKKVVGEIKPNIIIIWGHRLWRNLPKEDYIPNEKNKRESLVILKLYKAIPILVVPHPSTRYFSYPLTESIQAFIQQAAIFNDDDTG